MEPLAIILGVSLIFVAAYAADQYTWKEKYAQQSRHNKHHADSNLHLQEKYFGEAVVLRKRVSLLEAFAPPERKPYEKAPLTWAEQNDLIKGLRGRLEFEELRSRLDSVCTPTQGHKAPEVLKIELGEDFAALKTSIDSLGSVAILKTELDRAHKREAIYMKRLLVSNAAILAASKKG